MIKSASKPNIDQKLLTLLVSSIKDYAMFMTDPQGYIISWNRGGERIKGYKESEIIGQHISVFYTKADIDKNEPLHNLNEALKNGSYESEGWRVRRDGSIFWASVTFTPLFDEDQKLLGFAKVTRDVTDRKKKEDERKEQYAELEKQIKANTERIEQAEIHYRKLIENSYDGIVLFDKDFNIFYRSPSAGRITGWEDQERDGLSFEEIIHPDDRTLVSGLFLKIVAKPLEPVICTFRVRHRDGHYIWLECTFNNELSDPDMNAIVCNFRDVTARKESDLVLQEKINELSAYRDALDESAIVAITDQKGVIKHANDNFCRISKYGREELLGQDHRIVNSSYHEKAFIAGLWQTIANGRIWKGELKNKAKDGSFYWVDTTIVPFLNEQGKPYQYLAIRSDITERKNAEIHLKELNESLQNHTKELSVSNEELEQFAYVASHDLQEPLRMITGFLTQLEKKYQDVIDDRGKQYIYFAVDGAKRMRQIILDLLEYSRAGKTTSELERINLNKVMDEMRVLYRKQLDSGAQILNDELPSVVCSKTPLWQVLQNLIGNALKYHKKDIAPIVKLTCIQTDTHWKFCVEDNGIGIEPEYFTKIFIIFQRLHRKGEYSGTGIGLAIAKKLVESLGGKIWVDSVKNEGSKFYFTILRNEIL